MAEESKSLQIAEENITFQTLNKLHTANYDIFRAKNEEDVYYAIKAILKLSPFINGYFTVTPSGLELIAMTEPPRGKNVTGIQKHIGLSAPEIAAKFSKEIGFTTVDQDSDLPAEIVSVLVESGATKAAYIPVTAGVETTGLFVFGAPENQVLDAASLQTFSHLASLLPSAISHLKSDRMLQRRLHEMESVANVGQTITTAADLQTLYKVIHQQIREVVGEVSVLIALYDAPTNTIQVPYRYEDGKIDTIESFPLGEGLTSILLRTQQPLMIVEDTERRAAELGAKVVGKTAKSWLGCPLLMTGEAIGAIIIQDTEQEKRFDQNTLRYVISLSIQVVGAIYNARLFEQAHQRAIQLQTAAEISRDVSGSLLVDDLFKRSVELIRERFGLYQVSIFLVDPSGEYASIREASGKTGIQLKVSGYRLNVGSNSIVGYVTSKGEPLIVNDVTTSAIHKFNPLLPETLSESGLPIKKGNRIIGVLDVQSTRRHFFSDEIISILQIVADQIAVAYVNSELFAETQERLSQHRLLHHVTTAAASSPTIEEALNSAVQGLQVTLGGDQIAILLVNKESKSLEVKSAIGYLGDDVLNMKVPIGAGITGWVAANKQPLRIDDVTRDARYMSMNDKVRSEMAIPLLYRNEVLGVLNVESPRIAAYSESDEEMLGTLGGSLAAIISHSQLLEQYRQQVEFDRLLYEVTGKIRRTSNINNILEITANELSKAIGARRARITITMGEQEKDSPTPGE